MSQRRLFLICFSACCLLTEITRGDWRPLPTGVTNTNLRAIHAVDSRVVWASGSSGVCLRTVDGGETWVSHRFPEPAPLDFRGLAALDTETAVLVSAGEASEGAAQIYRTDDGGRSWTRVFQTTRRGVFLNGVAFWDRHHGIVFGDPLDGLWYLLRTEDGGRSWRELIPEDCPALLPDEVAFAANNSAMVTDGGSDVWIASGGGRRARIFRSTDRGVRWSVADTPLPSGASSGVFGLRFWGAGHGIGVGGNHRDISRRSENVTLTRDAGQTWILGASTLPPGLKESVVALPGSRLLAVGPSGSSLSPDGGISWVEVGSEGFHAATVAEGHCWAAGANGTVAKWVEGNAPVRLIRDATDDSAGGLPCYRIETAAATYLLEKSGGGLSSLLDRDGHDWLGFHPQPGSGAGGEYRGFPNAVHQQAGNYFHARNSATDPCTMRVLRADADRVSIEAVSSNRLWACQYDFFPTHCTFTMTRMPPDKRYWILYEGTPGGTLDESDWWMRSGEALQIPLSEKHEADIPGPEWMAFGDAALPRALVLLHHQDDSAPDEYYGMQGKMTVFGFGRRGLGKYLDTVPQQFSIGFVEPTRQGTIEAAVNSWLSEETR